MQVWLYLHACVQNVNVHYVLHICTVLQHICMYGRVICLSQWFIMPCLWLYCTMYVSHQYNFCDHVCFSFWMDANIDSFLRWNFFNNFCFSWQVLAETLLRKVSLHREPKTSKLEYLYRFYWKNLVKVTGSNQFSLAVGHRTTAKVDDC
jgi:hypothetical protein